jgi:glycerate dehydrogenase
MNPDGEVPWDAIAALGELTVHARTPPALVVERARGAEIVLTNKTPLDAATLAALPALRYISVLATGYNVVDVAAARALGIAVSNVPEYGTRAVGQFVMAVLLELCHRVRRHAELVRAGAWMRCPDFSFWEGPLLDLEGRTIGIVGFGRIGQEVGRLAHAFGMRVLANSRRREATAPYPFAWGTVEELAEQADVLTLHCPLTAENEGMVNAALLARMRPTAWLINTARGGLVNEADLAAALRAGRLAAAAVDVVSHEPMRVDNPLHGAPNLLITPHIAWASVGARRRLMAETAANIAAYLAGTPRHVVS